MSAIDEAPDCVCGDPRAEHKRGVGGCRNPECGCGKFDPVDRSAPAGPVGLNVAELLAEAQADADRERELAARVAELELELARRPTDLDWAAVRSERDGLREVVAKREGQIDGLRVLLTDAERQVLGLAQGDEAMRAELRRLHPSEEKVWPLPELRNAVTELLQLRADVERLGVQLQQAEQYVRDLQDDGTVLPSGEVWDEHTRYLCLTCGNRYREHHIHPCGRLVPVRVAITFIKDGSPTK